MGWRDRPGAGGCPKPRPTSIIGRRGVKPGDLERLARVRLDGEPAKKRQRTMERLSSPKSWVDYTVHIRFHTTRSLAFVDAPSVRSADVPAGTGR